MLSPSTSIEIIPPPSERYAADPVFPTVRLRVLGHSGTTPPIDAAHLDRANDAPDTTAALLKDLTKLYSLPVPEDSNPETLVSAIRQHLEEFASNERQSKQVINEKDRAYQELRQAHDKTSSDNERLRAAHTNALGQIAAQHEGNAQSQRTHKVEHAAVLKERDDLKKAIRTVTQERDDANNTLNRVRTERNTFRSMSDRLREERNTARSALQNLRASQANVCKTLGPALEHAAVFEGQVKEFFRKRDELQSEMRGGSALPDLSV
ncbi:unnamed protein product [Peniophora sp. CBMAI 1063]|nr:unnamed protein product [Peniophora sp. CBMAI 1063]